MVDCIMLWFLNQNVMCSAISSASTTHLFEQETREETDNILQASCIYGTNDAREIQVGWKDYIFHSLSAITTKTSLTDHFLLSVFAGGLMTALSALARR